MNRRVVCLALLILGSLSVAAIDAGVARIDVTPAEPIRLTGYGNRKTNSIGVEQKLWAKALALGSDREGPALLLTLDNCGIAESTYRELVSRLTKKTKLKPGGIAIACSHTHSGPCTTDWAPNIFAADVTPEQQTVIDLYTKELIGKLESVALAALKDRKPAQLAWAQGEVGFARNRRVVAGKIANFGDNASGPVDHALPVLRVTDAAGKLRALVANYACHCTTLGGEFNHICGDWAGYAQEAMERDSPGATALITIGCGADANPSPRGTLALARQHGEQVAAEVKRLLGLTFTPLTGKITTGYKEIRLPFGPHFTRAEWEARAKDSGIVGYHAKKWLARLDRGEKPSDSLYYPINAWRFGDDLAMVFLPGEVVVDYALRFKKELDPQRLWVTAYANYVPCYIPSRRILAEGGYEAEGSLWYYDRPARISTNAEDLIIKTVHELLPKSFRVDPKKAEFPDPLTPKQALGTFRTKANFTVELVASEPLIESPVAIDWDARGRLWVCEMYDYPTGMKPPPEQSRKWGEPIKEPPGGFTPGGRIKILTSSKGDGHYDKATLFLDKLSFPTGVFPWRNGALICAAPDILYAEDTDGDGRADVVRTNFTGFATHNYQARVNGFRWGLDGWLHGSSGLFGGKIKSLLTGKEVDLGGRDFRIRPDTGEIEPLAGVSQFGRVRDDFDNWFGNDNSTLLWHYPLAEHYMRRNPHVTYPDPRVLVAKGANASRVFPASRTLERFNHPESANRVTSACGIDIYRDNLLGAEYHGNAFICEPVHNLVTRLVLEPDGVTFAGRRADDEQRGEFLASTDNWFRPVQVRTGPDGALWVVDMYRFVIEHPRWIAPDRLKTLDVRAGADMGRIYRVYPKGAKLRPIRDLTKLSGDDLVMNVASTNGPARDLVHQEILRRGLSASSFASKTNEPAVPARRTGKSAKRFADDVLSTVVTLHILADTDILGGAVAAQAVSILAQHNDLTLDSFLLNQTNAQPQLRSALIRVTERFLDQTNTVTVSEPVDVAGAQTEPDKKFTFRFGDWLTNFVNDSDATVRFQLALSLGEWRDPLAATLLARLVRRDDLWMRAAVLSSTKGRAVEFLRSLIIQPNEASHDSLARQFIATGVAEDPNAVIKVLGQLPVPNRIDDYERFFHLASYGFDAIERGTSGIGSLDSASQAALSNFVLVATRAAESPDLPERVRTSATQLLARGGFARDKGMFLLGSFVKPLATPALQEAAYENLRRQQGADVAEMLLHDWTSLPPSLRSRRINILTSREEWIDSLLAAVERKLVSATEVPLTARQALVKHKKREVRDLAAKLFTSGSSSNRVEVFSRFGDVGALTPASARGAALFDKHCAQCHAYRGHGHAVGPNLAEYAGKGVADFVLAILDPNAAINPNFLAYNVETKDERSLTGIVRAETASGLTLVQGGGVEEKILRSDIAEIRASALSLMPEGLEQALSPQDMADLIAWLKQGAPASFGHASANGAMAAKNRADFLKSGASSVAKVVSAAETLSYRSWIGTLPMTYCRQSAGINRLAWESIPPSPLTPALSPSEGEREKRGAAVGEFVCFRLPAAMGFLSQPQGKFTLHINGKPMLDFDVSLTDAAWASTDGRVRMNYSVAEANSEDSNGPLVIEVGASLLEAGKPTRFQVTGSQSASQRWFGIYKVE